MEGHLSRVRLEEVQKAADLAFRMGQGGEWLLMVEDRKAQEDQELLAEADACLGHPDLEQTLVVRFAFVEEEALLEQERHMLLEVAAFHDPLRSILLRSRLEVAADSQIAEHQTKVWEVVLPVGEIKYDFEVHIDLVHLNLVFPAE